MKVVAKALITDSEDRLLVLHRGMGHPNFPGHLDLPGGEVDDDEQWHKAVAREINEETGLVVEPSDLVKVFEIHHRKVIHVLYVIRVTTAAPTISLSWEHANFSWFAKSELLKIPLLQNVDRYYADFIAYLEK